MALSFLVALLPLVAVLVGIVHFRQGGARMAVVGLALAILVAVGSFGTPLAVALGSSAFGVVKSFGITIAVLATMLMVLVMQEAGALATISDAIRRVSATREEQSLLIGVGLGSFLTSLGVVTPALFPPLLVALGFGALSAVVISVLGYNATTSYALLSIPITLPAEIGGLDPFELSYRISLFLPVVSVGLALAILWAVGGTRSVRRSWPAAVVCGLAIALSCIALSRYRLVPVRLVGVAAGLVAMAAMYAYQRLAAGPAAKGRGAKAEGSGDAEKGGEGGLDRAVLLRALSPWLILIALAVAVSRPSAERWLSDLPGDAEMVVVFADQRLDLNFLKESYTWILVATLLSLPLLRPTRPQLSKALGNWRTRAVEPLVAYSLYFAIAYVMANSAKVVVDGRLVNGPQFAALNMNLVVADALAGLFGRWYVAAAAFLGLFGALVCGSEGGSNVMFLGIQRSACTRLGLDSSFLTVYASHATAGGVASAITPAKINNAVRVLGEKGGMEAEVMKQLLVVSLALTAATGLMTAMFVMGGA